jgi:cytoskeletal protein CcmA (bactofilin family)
VGFFSKQPEPKQSTPTPSVKSSNPVSSSPAVAPATLIGPEAKINGELVSSDNIHIEGKIEGKVKSTKQITIGQKGQVHAEIEAKVVSIQGKLQGDCVATGKVEITGTGKVFGNISAPRIAVAEGAVFRGASNMTVESKQDAKPPAGQKTEPSKSDKPPKTKNTGTSPSAEAPKTM